MRTKLNKELILLFAEVLKFYVSDNIKKFKRVCGGVIIKETFNITIDLHYHPSLRPFVRCITSITQYKCVGRTISEKSNSYIVIQSYFWRSTYLWVILEFSLMSFSLVRLSLVDTLDCEYRLSGVYIGSYSCSVGGGAYVMLSCDSVRTAIGGEYEIW